MKQIFAFASMLWLTSTSDAADWTQFRGPDGQGHANSSLPIKWDSQHAVQWKRRLPGKGWSSPVIQAGRIFVTAAVPVENSEDLSLQLLRVNAESGAIERQTEVFRQLSAIAPDIHSKNSHASPTPLLDGQRLYAHFGHQGTACLTTDGEVVWQNRSLDYAAVHGNGGSPILYEDHLIFSCDGASEPFVVALDKQTGEIQWRTPRKSDATRKFSFSTPLLIEVNGEPQVISPGSNRVDAYDPRDGREIWYVRYDGYSVIPRPVYGHGLVYISTGYNNPQVMAIRPDGEGDVTESHVVWAVQRGAPHTPSMLLSGPHLFMVSDQGVASCVDALTGESHWQKRLGGSFSASPISADGRIYFQSEAGEGIVIEASPEFAELARNELGERTLASYGIVDDSLVIRTADHLYRIRP